MMHLRMSLRSGMSNITSRSASSTIDRSARAPVLRSSATAAAARRAPSVNTSSTLSSWRNFWNWRVTAFFGSTRTRLRSSTVSGESVTITGSRPMNSGIRPNLSRSSGISFSMIFARSTLVIVPSAPKPIERLPTRSSTIFSSPSKAPPQMNSTFVVSIWMKSWWGCLRPPWGGTLATVPSRILSSACWTPSPETSRDIEVRGLDQAQEDVLDVLADVARLGERGRVRDAERHVEDAGQRLREERLAGASGPDEQDVRLLELDVVDVAAGVDPLVVVVDGDGEDLLRLLLGDDVLVQLLGDLAGVRELLRLGALLGRLEHLLLDDLLAQVDALVADVHALARDQLADLLLALAAERAAVG